MSELWVCLAPDTTTGSESNQIVAVCPPFDQSWSQDEAEANGYVVPWLDPSKVCVPYVKEGRHKLMQIPKSFFSLHLFVMF